MLHSFSQRKAQRWSFPSTFFTSVCIPQLIAELLHSSSLDEKKAQSVVDEIKLAGGDAIAVSGDVGADDFPQKVVEATVKYVLMSAGRLLMLTYCTRL